MIMNGCCSGRRVKKGWKGFHLQQDSNLDHWLSRPVLNPLSFLDSKTFEKWRNFTNSPVRAISQIPLWGRLSQKLERTLLTLLLSECENSIDLAVLSTTGLKDEYSWYSWLNMFYCEQEHAIAFTLASHEVEI